MEYLTVDEARKFATRRRLVAAYVPGVGARCVYCGSWGDALYRHCRVIPAKNPGVARRYHQCPDCGNKYESEEPLMEREIP